MTDIKITTLDSGRLGVTSPYNSEFVADAKAMGGRWHGASRQWTFDPRDEERLRELLRDVYGTDGSPADQADLVTVRWDISRYGHTKGDNQLYLAGRVVASRRSRDESVRLAPNVVLISGGFSAGSGSTKYPALGPTDGTVIEVRDIPRAAVADELSAHMTIVDSTVDIDALVAKREQLLAQIADIDRTLAENGHTVADTTDDTADKPSVQAAEQNTAGVITITIPVTDGPAGLSTTAYAGHAGVSPRTVRRWASNGRVPATRTPSGWIITA
ncbi:hypothetical protein [Streptomyces sp. NPDC003832]